MAISDILLTSPASILAAYIIDTLGSMTDPSDEDAWPLYVSHLPDGSDVKTNCGCVYDTSGVGDGRLMDGRLVMHQGVQIRIRSSDYEAGWLKIEDIVADLDDVQSDILVKGGETYQLNNVSRRLPIESLGVEPGTKRRYLFTVNFLLTVKDIT